MNRMLTHIRILDLSRLLPGAYCTQLLADLGAKVLKVEQPGPGDYMRQINPYVYGTVNRNKESMTLNFKHPKGREILLRLIQDHDVLLESFRPGVMERLNLGYAVAQTANPRLVYCSLSGYGQDGPYRLRSGHDINYLAVSGILGFTAEPGELPIHLPLPFADLTGSLMASHAILAGLVAREQSGKGTYIDAAMTDACLSFMSARFAAGLGTGKIRRNELLRGGAYDVYRTGDGRVIALGALEDKFWGNLATAVGKEAFAKDPRFATDSLRSQNRKDLRQILEPVFLQKGLQEWLQIFDRWDVPAAPVNQMEEVETDPQVRHGGLLFDLDDGHGRKCRQVRYPAHFRGQEEGVDQSPPAMGKDTQKILATLGYGDDKIRSLKEQGIV